MNTDFLSTKFLRALFIICTGGMSYYNFEIIYRGYSHISMFICGGLSFYTIGILNENPHKKPSFLKQMFLGASIITAYEYFTGIIVNQVLHLHVWDYSNMPLNIKGQICLPFTLLWFFLTPLCIITDDVIRYALFQGKKPNYKTLDKNS